MLISRLGNTTNITMLDGRVHCKCIKLTIYLKKHVKRIMKTSKQLTDILGTQLFTVGLIAQLVEHCTFNAKIMGSNPVEAWIFFRL